MEREIIRIDEEKCDGCGLCIPNCHEGALQLIDGKARLVSDLMCDGLGACIGHCPQGAITMEKREAEPYDEMVVMSEMVSKGKNTLIALINEARINTITVMKMEVPCCGGLLQLTQMAAGNASRKVPVKAITVGIKGNILDEQWI